MRDIATDSQILATNYTNFLVRYSQCQFHFLPQSRKDTKFFDFYLNFSTLHALSLVNVTPPFFCAIFAK